MERGVNDHHKLATGGMPGIKTTPVPLVEREEREGYNPPAGGRDETGTREEDSIVGKREGSTGVAVLNRMKCGHVYK